VVWQIPPIAVPVDPAQLDLCGLADFDGVKLFMERLADASGEAPWSGDADVRLIADIVVQLDGLPLAIELAAARAPALGLRALADRLDDRLGLLGGGSRTTRDRHQTLLATVDWSYQLLPDDLRAVLRRLSVFAGGFTLEAAQAVTPSVGDVAEQVVALVERSLLVAGGHPARTRQAPGEARYRMLETIRQFAVQRLGAEEGVEGATQARDAHSRHFAELSARAAGALVGRQHGQWLTTLEDEYANVGAAITYLLEQPNRVSDALRLIVHLDRFWHHRGHLADCASLLRRALHLSGSEVTRELRCAALNMAAQAAVQLDADAAIAYVSECLPLATGAGDDYQAALALQGLAWAHFCKGEAAAGLVASRESVARARRVGDPVLLCQCLVTHGNNAIEDLPSCETIYIEAIELARRSGDRGQLAFAYNNLGCSLLAHQDWSAARENFERAQPILEEIGMPNPSCLLNLGWVHLYHGERDQAVDYITETMRIARRYHFIHEGAYAMLGLACVAARDRSYKRAATFLGFADAELDRCRQSWSEPERIYRDQALAEITSHLGRRSDTAYDSGRLADWEEMLELAQSEGIERGSGATRVPDDERLLATILFADIVGSTEQLATVGDKRWRAVLDEFERGAAQEVAAAGGRIVKSTGDGLLATFDGPARAVRCGFALHEVAVSVGSELRVGVHTGEIERRGEDIVGIAVHIAARILPLANAGEVLVSRTVRDLVAGSGLTLTERGIHHLKGIADDWQIFRAQP
jgi:predicted ATPase/class 3 adenylate cyclase